MDSSVGESNAQTNNFGRAVKTFGTRSQNTHTQTGVKLHYQVEKRFFRIFHDEARSFVNEYGYFDDANGTHDDARHGLPMRSFPFDVIWGSLRDGR